MAASDEQSAIFNVAARFPLITAHYVLFGHDGKPIASGNTVSRSDRMVFEVETPYYRLGVGGAFIEDTVIVREDGPEIITTLSRDLIVL